MCGGWQRGMMNGSEGRRVWMFVGLCGLLLAGISANEGLAKHWVFKSGTCLNKGCIPSKVMIEPADLIRESERGERIGLRRPRA